MAEPSLALQKAIRTRLVQAGAVTLLVPADCIFDRSGRPEKEACIVIGDGETQFSDKYRTFFDRASCNVNIWKSSTTIDAVKEIAGAVRDSLPDCPWIIPGYSAPYVTVTGARYLRDPENVYCRAILTVEAIMQRAAA
jgi:hypothetical protein